MATEEYIEIMAFGDDYIVAVTDEDKELNEMPMITQKEYDEMVADDELFAELGLDLSQADRTILEEIKEIQAKHLEELEEELAIDYSDWP